MATQVFLVRHGVTEWNQVRRVLGHRDVGLAAEGKAQAQALARGLASVPLREVLCSPLLRAVQTAEILASRPGVDIARDPRLIDFRLGAWEGQSHESLDASPEYQRFLADPLAHRMPDGESLPEIRDRAVAALEQALRDAPAGEPIAVVTHAGIVRVILAHYLGASLGSYHRLRVSPGSASVLSFGGGHEPPRVQAMNWRPELSELL